MSESDRWQRRIFSVTWLSYAGYYLCRRNFSILMPLLVAQLGYSNDQLATAIFGYSAAYAAGQFLMGPLSDRFGARRVVAGGMFLSSLATMCMAFTSGFTGLLILQTVNGFAQSAGWSGLVKTMAAWFPQRTRGVVMAWWSTNYVAGGFLAATFATFAATGPIAASLGWQRGLIFPSILLAIIAVIFSTFSRDTPTQVNLPAELPPSAERSRLDNRALFRNPLLHIIACAYFFLKLTRYAFLFWLPLYMVNELHYATNEAGYISSLYELVGFAGVLIAGYVSDRWMSSRRLPVGAIMMVLLAGACLVYPSLAAMSRLGAICGIALIGMFTYGPDTLLGGAATQDLASEGNAASAAGYVNGVGSIGQLISPFVVSGSVRMYGWNGLFYLFVGLSLLGAAALMTHWNAEATARRQLVLREAASG